ncbi:S-layer homology domain-containing protein [Patescibacteria group bacterium]|nr:S-layer homology domain-containing protein [Patescibacteria group bacterium]
MPGSIRLIAKLVLMSLLLTFLPTTQIAEALTSVKDMQALTEIAEVRPGGSLTELRDVQSAETRYGLVAILVSEDVYNNTNSYSGLKSGISFARNTLSSRINVYAEDVQSAFPWTKSMIITVEADDSTVDIQKMLERLYYEGDPNDNDFTKLAGIVVVGDVPLPVVNKNGYRFVSLLPYTDFEEPSYIVDSVTQDFVPNQKATNLQADIWHGVIVPPVSGEMGYELLATFFDKNHEYHLGSQGEEQYSTFDKKVFLGDFVTENATLNQISFQSYSQFLKYWEELAYYRFSNDMVEEIFLDITDEVQESDGLDNDGDGILDEEVRNGLDDDGDGLIDEDLGDGFYGVDNDGDCSSDTNGDGLVCRKGDAGVDEDNGQDNNNDAGKNIYKDYEIPFFEDRMTDEDPPGDANGDGCPGVCNEDDNGNAVDHDGDGYPTGWELAYGYEDRWNDARKPHKAVSKMVKNLNAADGIPPKDFGDNDKKATEYLQSFYTDEDYRKVLPASNKWKNGHPSCFDNAGVYHPEWDDDEDGFCDEDGSIEIPVGETCAYNDNDCDGQIDEDPIGFEPQPLFDELPDIQSKQIVNDMVSRYVEIFDQPLGVWNRIVQGTGRYKTRQSDGEATVNEYDSAVSLISKKDEAVLQYLRAVNDYYEARVNGMVNSLQVDIPLVGGIELTGLVTFEDGSQEDLCKSADNGNKGCVMFVNHTTTEISDEKIQNHKSKNIYIYGKEMGDIEGVAQCSLFGGTANLNQYSDEPLSTYQYSEPGGVAALGQFVQFTALYSKSEQEYQAENMTSKSDEQSYKGCLLKNSLFEEDGDIPEICFPVLATTPVRDTDGAIAYYHENVDGFETGPAACYEYRELDTFQIYSKINGEKFSDKVTKWTRKDDEEWDTYEEVLAGVAQLKDDIEQSDGVRPGEATLRSGFDTLDIYGNDTDRVYTLQQFFNDFGIGDKTLDELDFWMTFRDQALVQEPTHLNNSSGNGDVDKLKVNFDKYYVVEDENTLVKNDPSQAKHISSVFYHTNPKNEILNTQIEDGATPNLPIDSIRYVTFMDSDEKLRDLYYVNVFDASNLADVQSQINDLYGEMANVSGGNAYTGAVNNFLSEINQDQLKDALDWYNKNIDQKHEYIFTHYLGDREPATTKARDGYEIFSLIANGTPTEIEFAFNGDVPPTEEDLMFLHRSQEAVDEALSAAYAEGEDPQYEEISDVGGTIPVPLAKWLEEIQQWLLDIQDSTSSAKLIDNFACATEIKLAGPDTGDKNGNGVPDSADATVSIELSSEDNNVLTAEGQDYYVVTASARKSDGSLNLDDNYTEIELNVLEGLNSVDVKGTAFLQLTSGVATFVLESAEEGNFRLRGDVVNRDDVGNSNTLSGSVTKKFVNVTSYIIGNEGSLGASNTGSSVEVYDGDGVLLAVFDPVTGDLELRNGSSAEVLEGEANLPTRVAINDSLGVKQGEIFIVPALKEVFVGSNGISGVFVEGVLAGASAEKVDTYVSLFDGEEEIGIVTALGQISVTDTYRLDFSNPGEINLYEPILVLNSTGETVFTVQVLHPFVEAELVNTGAETTAYDWPKPKRGYIVPEGNIAYAASVIPDSDSDFLDDLEEWTIGTDMENADSDGDGFNDGTEIFSGFDPLVSDGALLFSDLNASHVAYHDIVTLYLRGVLRGYGDGTFKPDNPITREEFMQIDLGGICVTCQNFSESYLETLMNSYNVSPFPDQDINPELLACVAEGKVRGIVSGYAGGASMGYFLPRQLISRAEATKVLVETAGYNVESVSAGEVWYKNYVLVAQENGLFPKGRFTAVDTYSPNEFETWFDADQVGARTFKTWLETSISRSEFAEMAVNLIEAQDCRELDSDGDGLSDSEEDMIYSTDKNMADTDGGGVYDFDEIVRGSDPLDASDDFPADEVAIPEPEQDQGEDFTDILGYDHDPGVFGVGDNLDYVQISETPTVSDTDVKDFTNLVAADGQSYLFVRAEIRDLDDNIYFDDNTSVIEFILSDQNYAELASRRVQVKNGIAETVLTSKTSAGNITVDARISDGSLPSRDANIQVYAGEPSHTDLSADSNQMPAGGESVNNMRVTLLDSFNNVANFGYYIVTLNTEGGIQLLDVRDEDLTTDGVQVSTSDGFVNFRVLSSPDAGLAAVTASLPEIDGSEDRFEIEQLNGMELEVLPATNTLYAGSSNGTEVQVNVVDANGRKIDGFQGDLNLSLSDPGQGSFADSNLSFTAGTAIALLSPGTTAGPTSIIAVSPGILSGSAAIEVKPADPYELRIRKNDGTNIIEAGVDTDFILEVFDVYGNKVDNDSTTVVDLKLTEATKDFGRVSPSSVTLRNGEANFTVIPKDISGKMNILGTSEGLIAGVFGGDIRYVMDSDDFKNIEPQMLYGSLLGAGYGDVTTDNYLGGWMTFNGTTQAIISMLSDPQPKAQVVSIDAMGNVSLPKNSMISQIVLPATKNLPVRIQWRSFPDDKLAAEVFYVKPANRGMTTELLTDGFNLEIKANGTRRVLTENGAAVLKLREDGQIEILDPKYSLAVNGAAEGLGFVVTRMSEPVMIIGFKKVFSHDVDLLSPEFMLEDWAIAGNGIHVRPTVAYEHNFVSVPSGNSTAESMGLALINPDENLPVNQQPSLGYKSLENAENDGTVGWENENKNILLFSAGNSAGESNMYYASEIGVLLGDPTVSITEPNEVNDLGFTADVGTQVYASRDEIFSLLDMDYNGDDLEDVLVAYQDGRIDVLQNYQSTKRLDSRGTILNLESGIRSIDVGNFNNDRFDDLLIVTQTACKQGENCLYEFENIGGGFVAKYLGLQGIDALPKQIEVADLNNDGYDEIVIFDENLNLYIVWNEKGEFAYPEKVERDGFALEADSTVNLSGDVVLRYKGLDSGSVSLPIPVEEFVQPANVDTDLENFLDLLNNDGKFDVSVDGVSTEGETVEKRNLQPFEYADSVNIAGDFAVSKRVTDSTGGKITINDTLSYTISIRNTSGAVMREVYFSDYIGDFFRMDKNSFVCMTCGGGDANAELVSSSSISRPFIFGPFDLNSGESMTFSYEAKVTNLPDMNIMIADDFYDDYNQDDYLDIAVSPDGNATGRLIVYYSDGEETVSLGDGVFAGSYNKIQYRRKEYNSEDYSDEYDNSEDNPFKDENGDMVPDLFQIEKDGEMKMFNPEKGIPVPAAGQYDPFSSVFGAKDVNGDGFYSTQEMFKDTKDSDGDGLYDTVDQWQGPSDSGDFLIDAGISFEDGTLSLDFGMEAFEESIKDISNKIEDVVSEFTCEGGCINGPPSIAFLAPGTFHDPFTGIPLGWDPGTPLFGILGFPPGACVGNACYASWVMRTYLAPTTTLGLGFAMCFGPYGGGQCWAYAIPLLQSLGFCDAMNGFIADVLSKASSFNFSGEADAKIFKVSSAGGFAEDTGFSSSIFDGYKPPVSVQKNISVPGFPSIFTEWWKKQKMEFFKMLDLPDVTFIVPDPASIATEFKGFSKEEREANPAIELETNFMGMEKMLNFVNSLPLVDIQTKKVYFKYPWITPEEIELIKKDARDWVQDTINLKYQIIETFNNFAEEFPDLANDLYAVRDEAVAAIEKLIQGVEDNMAVIESYGRLPQQILELRNYEAYYAKIIVCYLDAFLSFTAGYLKENFERIEAWGKWVIELKNIVANWQALIDVSIKFMDSCDKCTNQRYSLFQLLLSLFVVIPEPPVIPLPKWPDIVIDVSDIQAGVDIIWPDLVFVPENINFPELPRLSLPIFDLELALNLKIDYQIPVLPEIDLSFLFPELPGLPLPELPDIPPPPAIPDLDGTIEVTLDIVSSILRIICTIRQGFLPTPEYMLKTKIEEITQRPALVLPIDLAIEVEYPPIKYDFLRRIEVVTYLHVLPEFTVVYDVVKGVADKTNGLIVDLVSEFEDLMAETAKALQEAAEITSEDLGMEDDTLSFGVGASVGGDEVVGLEVDGESSETNPGIDSTSEAEPTGFEAAQLIAEAYKDYPLLQSEIKQLNDSIEVLTEKVNEWNATYPDTYEIKGSQRLLALDDPLLNRYDEIVAENQDFNSTFIASIQGTPLSDTLNLRNSMIAYVDSLEEGTEKLSHMEGDEFNRYLVMEQGLNDSDVMLAGNENELGVISNADKYKLDDYAVPEEDLDIVLAEDPTSTSSTQAQKFDEGIYIFNDSTATKLIEYKKEVEKNVSIVFVDLDNDGDEDVVYSMGGDVYYKENFTKKTSFKHVSSNPERTSVAELSPAFANVKNNKTGRNTYEESSFSFDSSEEADGYEVMLYDSLDAMESEPDENVKRVLLLDEEKNETYTLYDNDEVSYGVGSNLVAETDTTYSANLGESDFEIEVPAGGDLSVPNARPSRLYVEKVSGKVSLLNAMRRTEIRANTEFGTGDELKFQTLKDSTFKLTINDLVYNVFVPENSYIVFNRQQNRVLRLERGEAVLIQDEIVDSQDLKEGWEVFKDEVLVLENNSSKVTLKDTEGAEFVLDKKEVFVMDRLLNSSNPSAQVELENGAYYSVIRAVHGVQKSTVSDNVLLNPQICGDSSAPYPILSNSEIDLAIFSTTQISAENSFDSDSEIVDSFWDLDENVDTNGDGIMNNDEEIVGLTAEIGPYDTVSQKTVTLWITDAAGNTASAKVKVNILVPEIILEDASIAEVSGTTNPESPIFPFGLVRERQGEVTHLGAGYLTDDRGDFVVDGFNNSNLINVYNADGDLIAQFNPTTKQLIVLDERYEARALVRGEYWPARLVVVEKAFGIVEASFIFVANDQRFVTEVDTPLADFDLSSQETPTVYVANDNESYSLKDGDFVSTDENGVVEMKISRDGNISFFDERFEIVKRPATSLDEYLILDIYDDGVKDLEVYPGSTETTTLTTTEELELPSSEPLTQYEDITGDFRQYFEDISEDDPLFEDISELVERGVIAGYVIDGETYFKPDQAITRAEFTKIILGILCITPRDSAAVLPAVFNDILDKNLWYFAYTKESYLRDFITGYLAEIDVNGMTPFKPNTTINRAEAVKIMLEALDKEGIIALPEDLYGVPWYEPYIEIAQDMTPYMITESVGAENYIITPEEALDPLHILTRYEWVEMSVRALNAYNCFELDSDGDGLYNYEEESIYGSDPYNPDTDGGGVNDGAEVARGSDPLDPDDDFPPEVDLGLTTGIYVVQEPCTTCPCLASIDYDADLRPGDSVFAIIENDAGEIFGMSNTLIVHE